MGQLPITAWLPFYISHVCSHFVSPTKPALMFLPHFLFLFAIIVFFLTFFMSARSQFYVANKTCSPTFAASRQNSDLSPGSQPHNAARDHPHHQDHHALGQNHNDDEQDEDNECVYKLSFPTFNC